EGHEWVVVAIDGTREAARQRALPQAEELPPAVRRLDGVCAPGFRGRTLASRGQRVWLTMHVLQRQAGSRSNCSVFPKILLSRLASNKLDSWAHLIAESLEKSSGPEYNGRSTGRRLIEIG